MDLAAVGMEAHPSLEYWKPELTVGSLGGFPVGSYVGVAAGQQRSELSYGQSDSLFGQGNGAILHRGAAEMLRSESDICFCCRPVNFLLRPGGVRKTVWIRQRFH